MPELERPPTPLSAYLQPHVSPARLARNREVIRRRLAGPRWLLSLRNNWGWGFAMAGAAAVLLLMWSGSARDGGPNAAELQGTMPAGEIPWEPAVGQPLVTEEQAARVVLRDGSRVELQPHTALALAEHTGGSTRSNAVELDLRAGRATFDVTHDTERSFRVHAGGVTVTVLGTRFSVVREAGRVNVAVERGKVAVSSADGLVHLKPGERWEGSDPLLRNPASDSASNEPLAPAASEVEVDAEQSAPSERRETASGVGRSTSAPALSAKQLFDGSREARRAGDSPRAAALLEQLVATYPKDPRAGLAAFELGRIRMDVLGDAAGAARAIEQALRLSPRAGFRQDAMARLVQAYDRVGRSGACQAAKRRYLAAYGEGVHAQTVLKHCP